MLSSLKKHWLRQVLFFCLGLVALLSIAPIVLYNNQHLIADRITTKLNALQEGHTTVKEIHISPFKTFPYISIDLSDLNFYTDKDQREKIYNFHHVYVGFNAWELLRGNYQVKKIIVQDGNLHIKRDQDGNINLLIAKGLKEENETDSLDERLIAVDLQSIEIKNVTLEKTDAVTEQHVKINIEQLSGSFTQNAQQLTTHVALDLQIIDIGLHDLHFFTEKHIRVFSDLVYADDHLSIQKAQLEIEGGVFSAYGGLTLKDDFELNLDISGQKPDFKLLTSFAPAEVYQKLERYRNEGEVYFRGKIQGGILDTVPKIEIEFGCKNASFINPDANKSIRDLSFSGFFTNGEARSLRTSELYLENLSGKPEDSWIKGGFHIQNFDDPHFSIDLHADLDLVSLRELIDLSLFEEIGGRIKIDMTIDELLEYNDTEGLIGKLKDGTDSRILLENVHFFAPTYYPHPIHEFNATLSLVDGAFKIDKFDLRVEDSDLSIKGLLSNVGDLLHGNDADVTAVLQIKAHKLNLPLLLSFDSTWSNQANEVISDLTLHTRFLTNTQYIRQSGTIPQGEFLIDSLEFRLRHYAHLFRDFHADFVIDNKNLIIKRFFGNIDKSDIDLKGSLNNYPALLGTGKPEIVRMHMDVTAQKLIPKDLFTYKGINYLPEEYKDEQVEGFEVIFQVESTGTHFLQGNLLTDTYIKVEDLHGKFRYHQLKFENIHGELSIKDSVLHLRHAKARLGKSDIAFDATLYNFFDSMKEDKGTLQIRSRYLDMDQLLSYEESASDTAVRVNHDSIFNIFTIPFPNAKLKATIGELVYHKYHLKNIQADMHTTTNHYLYIDQLDFDAADGHIQMKGYFDGSNPENIYLSSDMRLENTDIDQLFFKFDNFGQDYLLQENIHGRLSGQVRAKVRVHTDLTPYLNQIEAHAELTIKDGSLVHFPPFELLANYMGDKDLKNVRFGKLTNVFDIKNGRVDIPRMEIASTLGYLFISGKQDFARDLQMDYLVEVPFRLVKRAAWNALFKKKNSGQGSSGEELIEQADKNEMLLRIQVFGTPDDFDFKIGKGEKGK